MSNIYEAIKEYVWDHYKYFEFYPIDVEVDDVVYNWDQYWEILDEENV